MTKSLWALEELPRLPREVAILLVGAHEQAAFEYYAHSATSSLPKEDLERIWNKECPEHLDDACKAAFQVANELCVHPGPLPAATYDRALTVLGKQGLTALIQYVGFYKYVSTILNGFDCKVPT